MSGPRTTRLLAAILGLALVGGTGCATAIIRATGVMDRNAVTDNGRLPPYYPLVGDVAAMAYPPLTPIAIADLPLTAACETVYLPFFIGGEIIDHVRKADRDMTPRELARK